MALQPRRLPLLHRPGKSRGGAAPQMRHPLGSGAALPVLARSRVAGSSQDGSRSHYKLQEPKKRAGSTRSSRRRLPAVPARAALTASFLGVSAGGGPATLRPESCRSRAGATASRSAPGPPPGSPAPGPALSSPLRPQPYPPEAGARGAAGIAATGGSRSTGSWVSAPTREAPGLASQGGTARAKRVGFRLCPSRPLQSLGDRPVEAGRDRACPGTPWRDDWGLHCLSISLLATSFLHASSVEAHSHHLLSMRVPVVRVRKLRPTDLQQLAKDL